jgi:hypothetical protein
MESELFMNNLNEEYYKSLKGKAAIDARIREARLPMLSIAGEIFFPQVAFGILTSRDHLNVPPIHIGDLEMQPQSRKLWFFYHLPSMERVTIPADIKALPKDVVRVEIPNMYYLDPIGMAKKNDKELRYYLSSGYLTQRMFRKARIIPLEKTEIAELVRRNNEQLVERKASTKRTPLPVRKVGKRKGL